MGVEYYINDNNSITAGILYRLSGSNRYSVNEQKRYDIDFIETDYKDRIQDEDEDENLIEYSFNYTGDYKDESTLTFDFKYEESSEAEIADIQDVVYLGTDPNTLERNTQIDDSENILIQMDYVKPIGESAQFEAGYRSNLNHLLSDYLVETYENNQWVNNTDFSNVLDFQQNVHALYLQYGNKWKNLNFLLGLRGEYTQIK